MSDIRRIILDPFDLAVWPLPFAEPQRVYGSDALDVWALVDAIDYPWAVRWPWSVLRRPGRQPYLRRSVEPGTTRCPTSGVVVRSPQRTLYLHVEIMRRTGVAPSCGEHKLVDHINKLTLDCTRENLRWATYSMNNKNK